MNVLNFAARFRTPTVYLSLSFVILALGFGLLTRDLGSLVENQRKQTEMLSSAAADLLPSESLELSLKNKDSESPEKRLLKEALLQIRLQMGLAGHLHVLETHDDGFQVVASTEGSRLYGDPLELDSEAITNILNGLRYTSGLVNDEGRTQINSAVPLLLSGVASEAALVFESEQTRFVYQLTSLGVNYLLIFLGIFFLGGIYLFLMKRNEKTELQKNKSRFENMFTDSSEPYLVIQQSGKIVRANPAALELFDSHAGDIEGSELFSGNARYNFVSLETPEKDPRRRLQDERSLRFKAKIINMADEARYLEVVSEQISDDECLLRLKDISDDVMGQKIEGLDNIPMPDDSSFYDELTGLPNFNYLRSVLETQWDFLEAGQAALLIVDLDDFQALQTNYGDEASEKLLKEFALFLRKYFRQSDNIIHYTMDKFMVLLPKTDLSNAERIATTLLQTAKRKNQDRALFSVGVACLEKGEEPQEWISRAAAALDTAKSLGKGRVEVQSTGELEILN